MGFREFEMNSYSTICPLVEESTKEIVRRAAAAVGSLRETEFDVKFNPDVFSPGVCHPDANGPALKKQRQLVEDAAGFLLTVQLPTFVSKTTYQEAIEEQKIFFQCSSFYENIYNK